MLSRTLENTLQRAVSLASARDHEYATLEHLLLSLADDTDAATVLRASGVDLDELSRDLTEFLDKDLAGLMSGRSGDPKPTAGFQRVMQRAAIHVQSSGRDEVTGANVLLSVFSERESQAVLFLQRQGMTRQDAANFIDLGREKARHTARVKPPPRLPTQSIGPHVEINSEGVIGFPPVEVLDRQGNYLPRLCGLHPDLRELARELAADLSKGNAPHAALGSRVAAYAALIDQDLQAIDFRRLYGAGVRLANSAHATGQAISVGELPTLEPSEQEKLNSLLDLHGPIILATAAGAEAMADEERYRRRPAEERRYRADAVALATAVQGRPDLIEPDVAEHLLGAAREIGEGGNPERSTVAGRAMVRNVIIGVVEWSNWERCVSLRRPNCAGCRRRGRLCRNAGSQRDD